MPDPSSVGAGAPAATTTASGRALSLGGAWFAGPAGDEPERDRLLGPARESDAGRQLVRCFVRWARALEHVRLPALRRLADNQPVDPNDPDVWRSRDEHAQAVLRRHGLTRLNAGRLTMAAVSALIDGQARADRDAGLDWTTITVPAARLDERLRRAHARLPIALDDPAVYAHRDDQRRALADRLAVGRTHADDLSRWVLTHPDAFDPSDLRCWRIGSPTWLELADEQLEPVDRVQRPVGMFVVPAVRAAEGWQLIPVLSLDAIRLIVALGGRLERDLGSAVLPTRAAGALLERVNVHTLHAGPRECLDSAAQLAHELSRELGTHASPGVPRDKRDRWGRLLVGRRTYQGRDGQRVAELALRVLTFPAREFTQRRLGAAPRDERHAQPSAVMDLGEAVQTAIERGLPLLLSTEAAGQLKDTVRVGRMKGRPGVLTITTSDGLSATTRRVVAEQAIAELRALKHAEANVTLDAGARQVVRMTLARPLDDDPVLLGRQKEMAALKVVGSGVDASQTGCGKTISSGRALAHRADNHPALPRPGRGRGAAAGPMARRARPRRPRPRPAAAGPKPRRARALTSTARSPDRSARSTAGWATGRASCSRPTAILDRYPADLQVIPWHLLIADEALRYANPATEAHQALAEVRFACVADCWLLTATPRGKSAEHLDVLVGLAVGDRAMIRERLNTREAGDLMDEIHAHRLRVNYGPHLVRVTRQDMQAWMPQVRPAEPLALEPDPALAELLEAIRQGGQEAYRRLLAVLRELKTLEPGGELFKQRAGRARPRPGGRARQRRRLRRRQRGPRDADALTGRAGQGAGAPGPRGAGDARRRRRPAAAARRDRADADAVAGEEQVIVFAERVWCLRQLAHTLRERHGVEAHVGDGAVKGPEFEPAQAALHQRRVPHPLPEPDRPRGPQPPDGERAVPPRPSVAAHRPRAARRQGRPPRRRQGLGADVHPLHQGRRHRARRVRPLPPRRRTPRRP